MKQESINILKFMHEIMLRTCTAETDPHCEYVKNGAKCIICQKQVEAWVTLNTTPDDKDILSNVLNNMTDEDRVRIAGCLNDIARALILNADRKNISLSTQYTTGELIQWIKIVRQNYQYAQK